jgi:hypothetical protein
MNKIGRHGARMSEIGGRLALAAALLTLAACNSLSEQMARSQVAATYDQTRQRLEAQGNPQFADPAKAAIVRRFQQDFQRFGRDAARLRQGASSTACAIQDPETAYRLIRGESVADTQHRLSETVAHVPDLDSIRISMISGTCEQLRTGGEVAFLAEMRAVRRQGAAEGQWTFLELRDSTIRVDGTLRGGERAGAFRTIEVLKSTRMDRAEGGDFQVTRDDWDHINDMMDAPTGIYIYETFGPEGAGAPMLRFMHKPESNLFSTTVEETQADGLVKGANYNGNELRFRYSMRNDRLHGWYKLSSYSENGYTVPAKTICFQNGEKVRATTCPTD